MKQDSRPRWVIMYGDDLGSCTVKTFRTRHPKPYVERIRASGKKIYHFARCQDVKQSSLQPIREEAIFDA